MPSWKPRCAGWRAPALPAVAGHTVGRNDPRFSQQTARHCRAILPPVLDDLVDGSSLAGLTDFILSLAPPCALRPRQSGRGLRDAESHRRAFPHLAPTGPAPGCVGPMVPRIFGPYEPIRRDLPDRRNFSRTSRAPASSKAVCVQTNWAKEDFEKEVAFLQKPPDRDRLAACHRRLCRHDGRRYQATRSTG